MKPVKKVRETKSRSITRRDLFDDLLDGLDEDEPLTETPTAECKPEVPVSEPLTRPREIRQTAVITEEEEVADVPSYIESVFGEDKCRSFLLELLDVEALEQGEGFSVTLDISPDLYCTLLSNLIFNLKGSKPTEGGLRFI